MPPRCATSSKTASSCPAAGPGTHLYFLFWDTLMAYALAAPSTFFPWRPGRMGKVPGVRAPSPGRVPLTAPGPPGAAAGPATLTPTHLCGVEGGEAHRLHHLYLLLRLALQILLCRGSKAQSDPKPFPHAPGVPRAGPRPAGAQGGGRGGSSPVI